MRILQKPHIPDSAVTGVVISEQASDAVVSLEKANIQCFKVKRAIKISDITASHADLHICQIGAEHTFCTSEQNDLIQQLSLGYHVHILNNTVQSPYPLDVALNCVVIGKYMICNRKTASAELIQCAEQSGLKIIDVKQGYTKCSVCVLNENAIITDDIGVYSATQKFFNDVTFISKGSVKLEGYPYGFFGGCCGLIAPNRLALSGRLDSHMECNKIMDALMRNHIIPIELTNHPLEDIGSIIPIYQE